VSASFNRRLTRNFLQKHKDVVEDQVKRWASAEKTIREMVSELNLPDPDSTDSADDEKPRLLQNPSRAIALVPEPHEVNYGLGANPKELEAPDTKNVPKGTMSQQTRVTLIQVLRDIFGQHGVCSLEFLRECLVKVARGHPPGTKLSAAEQAKVAAAGQGVAAPPQELVGAPFSSYFS
jgi:hypothetical protein